MPGVMPVLIVAALTLCGGVPRSSAQANFSFVVPTTRAHQCFLIFSMCLQAVRNCLVAIGACLDRSQRGSALQVETQYLEGHQLLAPRAPLQGRPLREVGADLRTQEPTVLTAPARTLARTGICRWFTFSGSFRDAFSAVPFESSLKNHKKRFWQASCTIAKFCDYSTIKFVHNF